MSRGGSACSLEAGAGETDRPGGLVCPRLRHQWKQMLEVFDVTPSTAA
jgi:hypothetical protein